MFFHLPVGLENHLLEGWEPLLRGAVELDCDPPLVVVVGQESPERVPDNQDDLHRGVEGPEAQGAAGGHEVSGVTLMAV